MDILAYSLNIFIPGIGDVSSQIVAIYIVFMAATAALTTILTCVVTMFQLVRMILDPFRKRRLRYKSRLLEDPNFLWQEFAEFVRSRLREDEAA